MELTIQCLAESCCWAFFIVQHWRQHHPYVLHTFCIVLIVSHRFAYMFLCASSLVIIILKLPSVLLSSKCHSGGWQGYIWLARGEVNNTHGITCNYKVELLFGHRRQNLPFNCWCWLWKQWSWHKANRDLGTEETNSGNWHCLATGWAMCEKYLHNSSA